MPYHKILKHQIEKLLPEECANIEKLIPFFQSVSNYYDTFERDKKLSEHAFQVSESEFINVTKELEKKTNQLEIANKELESFSYSVAHDLRTPLRSMNGFSEILIENYSSILDKEGIRYLNKIKESSCKMSNLIDDLLLLAKVTRHEPVRKNINLADLANNIIKEYKEKENKTNFIIDNNLFADCDNNLIDIVLKNLIDNAVKYSSKTSNPEVQIGKIIEDERQLFFVKDKGIGFDLKYSDKLFQPFQRLHNSESFSGTGIGLSIVKKIINKHGGKIWAISSEDNGATFFFTLK